MPSFRELLAAAKSEIREVDTAEADRLRHQPGAVVLDVREPDEYEQGAIPGAVHIARGNLESGIEGRIPDKATPLVVHCAGGTRSAFAAKTLAELGYTDVVSVAGGFNKWKDEGRDWSTPRGLTPDQRNRYQRHLLLPEVDIDGPAEAARRQGPPARRRWPRLPRRPLPGGGRRRHDRHHRHGRRRRLQPAAPDPPQHGAHRRAQGRLRQEDAHRHQPRRERRDLRRAPRRRQRARHPRRSGGAGAVGRHRRRHRQLPDPLPRQRRLGEARHPRRARVDLPLRGDGHRLRSEAGPDLPRHGARAAAGGDGPELRRGRRARRAARHRRQHPGHRDDQAAARPRRPAHRPAARLRRAGAELPGVQGATRPDQRGHLGQPRPDRRRRARRPLHAAPARCSWPDA